MIPTRTVRINQSLIDRMKDWGALASHLRQPEPAFVRWLLVPKYPIF